MLVNQPTVRVRSAPGSASSARPWASNSTSTPCSAAVARHSRTADAKAVSSTSLISAWKAAGTVVSRDSVTSDGSSWVR